MSWGFVGFSVSRMQEFFDKGTEAQSVFLCWIISMTHGLTSRYFFTVSRVNHSYSVFLYQNNVNLTW